MTDGLESGDLVRLAASRQPLRLGRLLGAGTQGLVYEVTIDDVRRALALKWYRPDSASRAQFARITRLMTLGTPGRAFLWPLDIAQADNRTSFGYVMPARDARFTSLSTLVDAKAEVSLSMVCRAAGNLADAFLALHARGLCYADISFGNLFVDPTSGDVQICDNDNVCVDGEQTDVLGTPYFMAPEIVRGEAGPSILTDRYALAVVLFYMLCRHHPLFGAREHALTDLTPASLRSLLGEQPLFIFDPNDESNRPVPSAQDNPLIIWPSLPGFVRELFSAAFTAGLRDPAAGRVTETQWRSAMGLLSELVAHCPVCGTQQFYDPQAPALSCAHPGCARPLPTPATSTTYATVVLEPGKTLYARHLRPLPAGAPDPAIAQVIRHPRTGVVALRNTSPQGWTLHRPDRPDAIVEPGIAVSVRAGLTLSIDQVTVRLNA